MLDKSYPPVNTFVKVVNAAKRGRKAPVRWNGFAPDLSDRHDRKRAAILAQAARLFDERGYHETSLAQVARRLHVTKPALYYYVKSKEDILTQIIEGAAASVEECAQRARLAGSSGLERLRLFVREYVALINTDFGRCLLTLRRLPVAPPTRTRVAAAYRRIDTLVRDLITEGIGDGSIRDCDVRTATFALFGAMIWVPNWFRADGTLTAVEAGDALFEVFARGLAADGAPRPTARASRR